MPGYPLGTPLSEEQAAERERERQARRAACHHEESLRNVGFGFGQLDYFCIHCEMRMRSVPVAEMTDAEKTRVGLMVGKVYNSDLPLA